MQIFDNHQINQIKSKGISLQTINAQLSLFHKGIKPVRLYKPATKGDGIEFFSESEIKTYIDIWKKGINKYSAIKFVPASGAASRMFKTLYEVRSEIRLNDNPDLILKELPQIKNFFTDIVRYPFYNDLNKFCAKKGTDVKKLISEKKYSELLDILLYPDGLNYGFLAKGLLKFHKYGDQARTPVEEHMVEASSYLKKDRGRVNLHFTVSAEHRKLFKKEAERLISLYEKSGTAEFSVSFSEQDSSTDTIAVDMKNIPVLADDGTIIFRPGGHGALLKNLEELNQEIAFLGNIDNVAPDRLKPLRIKYKELLGGILLHRTEKIHSFLKSMDKNYSVELKVEIVEFTRKFISTEKAAKLAKEADNNFIQLASQFFNRPIRVCGMVKNTGEPGGGPFWIINDSGEISKQIVESSQVEMTDKEQETVFNSSTHFNPVDLVCFIKDYKGNKFNLKNFVDPDMAFIAIKSMGGMDIKALELPGLWNGAMAEWITFFVEVPPETFSPVKTVFDLLRSEHL